MKWHCDGHDDPHYEDAGERIQSLVQTAPRGVELHKHKLVGLDHTLKVIRGQDHDIVRLAVLGTHRSSKRHQNGNNL